MSHDQTPAITSEVITVTPATYARAAMARLAGRWWWVAVAPMAMFLVASLWDTAYLFAAFIWLLMLLPPALMIAYYSYLLKPEAASMARPHRVTITPDGQLTVDFEPLDDNTPANHQAITFPAEKLLNIIERNEHIELNYRDNPIDLLIIPFAALPAPTASHALANLYSVTNRQQVISQ